MICNIEFEIRPSEFNKISTCKSLSCRRERILKSNNSNWRGGKYSNCQFCNKEFWIKPSRFHDRKTCSFKCSGLLAIKLESRAKEKNPSWEGGKTEINNGPRRSPEIYQWKQAVKRRDKKCVICGATENLHVDHIKPFCLFVELRFDVNNGRLLCAECHRKTPTYGNFKKKLKEGLISFD